VCYANGFGTQQNHAIALLRIIESAHLGNIKAMAIIRRVSLATGRTITDPRIKTVENAGLDDELVPIIEYWLLQGAQTKSLIALDDARTVGEEVRLKAEKVYCQTSRITKGMMMSDEPEFISNVRQALQHESEDFDRDYFATQAATPIDAHGNTYIHLVASAGYLEYMLFFHKLGCNLELENEDGETPLLLAMESMKANVAGFLLAIDMDPTRKTKRGVTPLHLLGMFHGQELDYLTMNILGIFNAHPDLNIDALAQEIQSAAHHYYTSLATGSPLNWVVGQNNVRAAHVLLVLGADPLLDDLIGWSPVYRAVWGHQADILKLFMLGEETWVQSVRRELETNFEIYLRALTGAGDFQYMMTLGNQFVGAKMRMIMLFETLDLGVENQALLLWYCCDCGWVLEATRLLQSETFQTFVDVKTGPRQDTCLARAILHEDQEMFDLLMQYPHDLAAGFDSNDACYLSMVCTVVRDPELKQGFLKTLIARGAKVNRQSHTGTTPILWALLMGDVYSARLLFENGAQLIDVGQETKKSLLGELITSLSVDPGEPLDFYFDSLRQQKKGIQEFIVDGAYRHTPLHLAVHRTEANHSMNKSLVMYLLRVFRDKRFMDYQDKDGDTALHIAALAGNTNALRLLLEAGADRSIENIDGETPLALVTARYPSIPPSRLVSSFVGAQFGSRTALENYNAQTRECVEILQHYNTVTVDNSSRNNVKDIERLLLGGEDGDGLDDKRREILITQYASLFERYGYDE
jgi:ankyrin repeat protein